VGRRAVYQPEDPIERSQQVRHLRQIYSRAKEVVSWISYGGVGGDPASSGELIECLVKNQFHWEGTKTNDRAPPKGDFHDRMKHGDGPEPMYKERKAREGWVKEG